MVVLVGFRVPSTLRVLEGFMHVVHLNFWQCLSLYTYKKHTGALIQHDHGNLWVWGLGFLEVLRLGALGFKGLGFQGLGLY